MIRIAALGLCLLGTGGCATSRWIDAHTPGDLWGTGGRETGPVAWLRALPAERPAPDEVTRELARQDEMLDAMIELVFTGLAVW